ncbi:hypothetical protein DRP07_10610 [Archaeoglobales archaeon]|nr:MAG: hypothetical protein DRP07_10610 [Archaeoglobales archaeon]
MTPIWKNFHSRSEGSRNRRRIEITKIGETIWLKAYPFRPIPVFRYEDADPLETGKVIHFRDCIGKTPTQIGLINMIILSQSQHLL